MNRLSREARAQILGLMVEGTSIRAISRLTGASKNTIVKLLEDAGEAFSDYQDKTLRGLTCKRIQVNEIWAFVYAKAKNVEGAKAAPANALASRSAASKVAPIRRTSAPVMPSAPT